MAHTPRRAAGTDQSRGIPGRDQAPPFGTPPAVATEAAAERLITYPDYRIQSSPTAGLAATAVVTVRNNATAILPTDADYCPAGLINGYDLEVELLVNGRVADRETVCLGILSGTTIQLTWAPQSAGTQQVEIRTSGRGSGTISASVTERVDVQPAPDSGDDSTDGGGGSTGGDTGGSGGGGGGGGDGGDGGGGASSLEIWNNLSPTEKAAVSLGVIGGVVALSSGSGGRR